MAFQFDPSTARQSTPGIDAFDPSTAKESNSGILRRAIADPLVSLAKGVVGVPETAVGIADLVTGGKAGKLVEQAGVRFKDAKDIIGEYHSAEQKIANQKVQEAEGFVDTGIAALSNPSTIFNAALESLPSMGAGGVAARGLTAGTKLSPVLAGAVGEGAVGAGQSAEGIRQQTPGGELTPWQVAAAVKSGVGTAAFGAAGGLAARKLGIADVDTMLAGGAANQSGKGLLRKVAEGAVSEGVLEEMPQSMQEQYWQNVALGRPAMEGVAEAGAMGALTGGLMGAAGGGVGHLSRPADVANEIPQIEQPPQTEPVSPAPVAPASEPVQAEPYQYKNIAGLTPENAFDWQKAEAQAQTVVQAKSQLGDGVLGRAAAAGIDSGAVHPLQIIPEAAGAYADDLPAPFAMQGEYISGNDFPVVQNNPAVGNTYDQEQGKLPFFGDEQPFGGDPAIIEAARNSKNLMAFTHALAAQGHDVKSIIGNETWLAELGRQYQQAKALPVSLPEQAGQLPAPNPPATGVNAQSAPDISPDISTEAPAGSTAVTEPGFEAAKALHDEYKKAVGNKVAEAKIKAQVRRLAGETPASHEKTVLALDLLATRLGMGEGRSKPISFAPEQQTAGQLPATQAVQTENAEGVNKTTEPRFISRRGEQGRRSTHVVEHYQDVTLDELPGHSFFTHQGDNGETVLTHADTGLRVASGDTEELAIKAAKNLIAERGVENVKKVVDSATRITDEDRAGAMKELAAKQDESGEAQGKTKPEKTNDAEMTEDVSQKVDKTDTSGNPLPQDGWRTNIFKARKYANDLGVTHSGEKLAGLTAKIDAHLAGNAQKPAENSAQDENKQAERDQKQPAKAATGGEAAATEKRDRKLKNTGADLRRWFDEHKPKIRQEWKQSLDDLRGELPSMLEALKREKQAKEDEYKDAVRDAKTIQAGDVVQARDVHGFASHYPGKYIVIRTENSQGGDGVTRIVFTNDQGYEQTEIGMYFKVVQRAAEVGAQAATREAAPQPAIQPTGELTTEDYERLFDEAAAELQEQTQEQPEVPPLGERVLAAGKKEAPLPDAEADKTAAKLAAEAAKLGVKGIDEAMKGLVKLFGGGPGKLQSFPGNLDEETYKQAKPHFEAALTAFQDAGKTIKELFQFLIQQFGAGVKPYAVQFAKEKALGTELGEKVTATRQVAEYISGKLARGENVRWQDLFAEADAAWGGTQAEGKYDVKSAYDAMEAGVNLWIRGNTLTIDNDTNGAIATVKNLTRIVNEQLPTQTKRTAEMDEFQQFSTPPALSYVANWVAGVKQGDVMMEPSAGTGDLAIWSEKQGANLILNELSSRRAGILKDLFPSARIFTENAEQLNNVLPADAIPTVVVMNPPFSATAGRVQGSRDTMNGAKHIEQALKRLGNGGRLVAIVGEGMAADRPAFRDWWKKIAEGYNVRANIGISGKEYAKYGTTFDNQILVIDKNGSTTGNIVTGKVDSVSDLPAMLEGIRNDRPEAVQQAEPQTDQPGGDSAAQTNGLGVQQGQPGGSATDAVGAGSGHVRADAGMGNGGELQRSASNLGGADTQPGQEQPATANALPDADGKRRSVRNRSGRTGAGRSGGDAAGGIDSGGASPAGVAASGVSIAEAARGETKGELTDSVFDSYKPQRLDIPGAKAHPGKLVQSSAMAAVEPPAATYTPNLPKEVITDGLLSMAQLESVVYAGQAHQRFLPNGERRGFFIGDGTGVGKGREISGIILDNIRQGRSKAVWVSFNEGLMNDAMRDFGGVGGDPKQIFWQGKVKPANAIVAKQGILFTAYSTLKSKEKKSANDLGQQAGKTRLGQVVQWLGEDFDGVIVFDEAHSMGNAVEMKGKRGSKKPSQQALAGVELQKKLPKARIVYVSATGATEVSNLGYASRLGLWGEGTAFPSVKEFIGGIGTGGVAAMELISRDMKALGMYIARSLSFDGVTYQRLEHDLTPIQNDIYNELAKAWQIVLQNVQAALKQTNGAKDGNAKSAAMSAFWGAHQRFFNQVITSLQTPTVIEDMRRQIAAGNAVVLQLVNTNEATQEREASKAQADGADLEELDFTPRQILMEYVKNGFPVQAHEETTDSNGNVKYRPVVDSNGNAVFDREAIAMRDALLNTLEQIRVPENPIDAIIAAFGSDKVGEVTGRKRRFVQQRDENGDLKVVEEKRGKNAAHNDAAAFQDDKKPILIFSQAGGTGFSFHADNTAKNQRKRIHYILQPGWRADSAVQGFGRTHRTNQAQEPHYVLPTTNLKAQKRFVSSIARRLDQLGALTRGQRQATSQGLFSASDNLESKYADDALDVLFQDLYHGKTPLDYKEIFKAMGFDNLIDKKTGGLNVSNLPGIPQFLNRLLSLQSHQQDEVFTEFEKRLDEIVNFAQQQGTYDNGLQTLKAESVKKVRDEVAYSDERTGAQTRYVELDVTNPVKYRTWEKAKEWAENHGAKFAGWFTTSQGKVFALTDMGERVDGKGNRTHRGASIGIQDGRTRYVDNLNEIKRGWKYNERGQRTEISKEITESEAAKLWIEQVESAPKTETRREHAIVGVILPIWDRVKGHPRIYRLQTDDGERMIGRMIGAKEVKETLKNLGIGSSVTKTPPADVLSRIQAGEKAILANGWEISLSTVSDEKRIEIKAGGYFSVGDTAVLNDQGVFFERIQWRERAFIPTGADGAAVFARVISAKPVVELIGKDGKESGGGMFSRNAPAGGMTKAAVNAVVAPIVAKWKHVNIRVVQSISELPTSLQHEVYSAGAEGDMEGVYTGGGTVYLVADHLADPKRVQEVLAHEAIGHLAAEELTDRADYQRAVNSVQTLERMGNKTIRALGETVDDRQPGLSAKSRAKEIMALAVENGSYKNIPLLQKAVTAITSWVKAQLRAMGLDWKWVNSMSEGEIFALLRQGGQRLEGGKQSGKLDAAPNAAMASRNKQNLFDENPNELTIDAPSRNGDDLERATRIFLSAFPEGTIKYFGRDTGMVRRAKAVSTHAFHDLGGSATRPRRVGSRLASFSGYETRAEIRRDFDGNPELNVLFFGLEQVEAGLTEHPALRVTVGKDGALSVYAPPSNSKVYGEFVKRGWAEPATNREGEIYHYFEEGGDFWTRLTNFSESGSNFGEVLGDVHARVLEWKGVNHSGFHWHRETGAHGGTGSRERAVYFSRHGRQATFDERVSEFRKLNSVTDFIGTLWQNDKSISSWMKTVGTQYHTAVQLERQGKPWLKQVFDKGQDFLGDVSAFAIKAESNAPSLFPRFQKPSDIFKRNLGASKADVSAIAKPLYEGTLHINGAKLPEGKVWSDQELRDRYSLTPQQIKLYREALAAVNQSSTDLAKAIIAKHAKQNGIEVDREMSLEDMAATVRDRLTELLDEQKMFDQGDSAAATRITKTLADVKAVEEKAVSLKNRGYFPLMRFGNHTVTMRNADGEVTYHGMFDSQVQADRAANALSDGNPGQHVVKGVMSKESWKLYGGLNLDALELFAEHMDKEDLEPYQEYLRHATSGNSAMKRMIHRKGIAGFSENVERTLAQMITSNARHISLMYNMADMRKAVEDTPKEYGDIKDHGTRLFEYLQSANEEASQLRGFLFASYIGGSIASAMVNLTQIPMMTAPFLSQFADSGKVTRALLTAAKMKRADATGELKDAWLRADEEGITAPQEIHQLTAMASDRLGAGSHGWQRAMKAWGGMFELAETFNRETTFVAAFTLARGNGKNAADAYQFAKDAVEQTQGIYNKGNRPNWGRGAIGATIFTFKQFGIMYLELLRRMPPRQRMLMLGMLMLAAGGEGLPFYDDITDMLDTILQWLGYAANTKRAIRNGIKSALGESAGNLVTHGVSAVLPIDIQARMSLANVVPGTSYFKQSATDKGREALEVLGVAGSLVASAGSAIEHLATGNTHGVMMTQPVAAIKNAYQGSMMLATGHGFDAKGRRTVDVTTTEALGKTIGFNPITAATAGRTQRELMQDRNLQRVKEDEILNVIVKGQIDKDRGQVTEGYAMLREWNRTNPELPVRITPNQIAQRVKAARMTSEQRFIKSTAPELRSQFRHELTGR